MSEMNKPENIEGTNGLNAQQTPPPMYTQQPVTQQPTTVNVQHRIVITEFQNQPMHLTCPHCNHNVTTKTKESMNWLCCLCFGLWACCFCQNVEHTCPNCNGYIGRYTPV